MTALQTIEGRKVLKTRETGVLKIAATKLMSRFDRGTSFALDVVLDELENRLSECEYVEFCESL